MNINLLAPTNKCSDFNVSFKEPIVIEANSKVQFNWVKLARHNGVVLEKDETIIIEPALPIPSRIPNAPGTLNLNGDSFATSNKVIIPQGSYSGKALQRVITEKINDFVGATPGIAHQLGFNTTDYYSGIDQDFVKGTNNVLKIGLETKPIQGVVGFRQTNLSNNNRFGGITLDVENHFNSTLTNITENLGGALGNTKRIRYRKTAQRATEPAGDPQLLQYDNYAMSQEHLVHYGVNNLSNVDRALKPVKVGGASSDVWIKNWYLESGVYAESVKTLAEYNAVAVAPDYKNFQENIYLGLYSREVATAGNTIVDDSGSTASTIRTGGTTANSQGTGEFNPCIQSNGAPNSFPMSYVSVEIGKNFSDNGTSNAAYPHCDYIIVRAAISGAKKLPELEISDSMSNMEIIHIDRITKYTSDPDYRPKIFLSTYFKQNVNFDRNVKPTATNSTSTTLLDESKLFFKVYLIGDDQEAALIYDSGIDGFYGFKHSFFNKYEDIGADTQSALRINTQLPFNVLLSAQKIADGWDGIRIKGMNKGGQYDNNPFTIIRGYRFILPKVIAKMINPAITTPTFTTEFLYPTTQTTILYDDNDNEEIRVDDITSAFKDEDISIHLDNLPLENYKNTELSLNKGLKKNLLVNIPSPFSDAIQSGILLTSKYSPNTPFITTLKNQEFKTNSLRILIKDSKTDRPIEDLISASVDFTILK